MGRIYGHASEGRGEHDEPRLTGIDALLDIDHCSPSIHSHRAPSPSSAPSVPSRTAHWIPPAHALSPSIVMTSAPSSCALASSSPSSSGNRATSRLPSSESPTDASEENSDPRPNVHHGDEEEGVAMASRPSSWEAAPPAAAAEEASRERRRASSRFRAVRARSMTAVEASGFVEEGDEARRISRGGRGGCVG